MNLVTSLALLSLINCRVQQPACFQHLPSAASYGLLPLFNKVVFRRQLEEEEENG